MTIFIKRDTKRFADWFGIIRMNEFQSDTFASIRMHVTNPEVKKKFHLFEAFFVCLKYHLCVSPIILLHVKIHNCDVRVSYDLRKGSNFHFELYILKKYIYMQYNIILYIHCEKSG